MVSLNCWNVIRMCLDSLQTSDSTITYEVIVVDNASTDDTPQLVKQHYPYVRIIQNKRNVGFTKATNQAIEQSSGRYILWLNTDTILYPDSLSKLCQFLDQHPSAGIVGPKVLNPDGTFQPQCKRGMPTPLASLSYLLKLDRLFPNVPAFGQYLLTYISESQTNQVDAVSGCCLMARREVWNDIGPLDEDFFGFGEDLEWCVRAKKAGWDVWYYPESVIFHLKGQGGVHAKPYHKIWGIHQGMWLFYRKYLLLEYNPLITALVWLGIWSKLGITSIYTWLQRNVFR
jgi:GT2 family glycosyltransferase